MVIQIHQLRNYIIFIITGPQKEKKGKMAERFQLNTRSPHQPRGGIRPSHVQLAQMNARRILQQQQPRPRVITPAIPLLPNSALAMVRPPPAPVPPCPPSMPLPPSPALTMFLAPTTSAWPPTPPTTTVTLAVLVYYNAPSRSTDDLLNEQAWFSLACLGFPFYIAVPSNVLAHLAQPNIIQFARPAKLPTAAAKAASGHRFLAQWADLPSDITHFVCLDSQTMVLPNAATADNLRDLAAQSTLHTPSLVPTQVGTAYVVPRAYFATA